MGEILSAFTAVVTHVIDVLVLPFGSHRLAGLIALSVLTGAGLTLLYRALADETAIRRTREVFKARVLEMRLYPDDLVLILRALGGAIAAQGAYLRVAAKPILIVALVAVPLFLQMEARYAHAPLTPGRHTLITARLKPGLDVRSVPAALTTSSDARVDPRSVRAPATREVTWRVSANAGRPPLELHVFDQTYRFDVCATTDNRSIGHERRARSLLAGLTSIGLPPIPADSPLDAVMVVYPHASYSLFGRPMSWVVVFLLGTVVGASVPAVWLRVAL